MRAALLLLVLVHLITAFAQPDPYPDIRVIGASISPAEPSTADTLIVSYQFVAPGACIYIRDWKVEGTGARRQLHIRVTRPPTSKCTTDKQAKRTDTLRIPPLPASDY